MEPISGQVATSAAEQLNQLSQPQEVIGEEGGGSSPFLEVMNRMEAAPAEAGEAVGRVVEVEPSEGPALKELRAFFDGVQMDEQQLDSMMTKSLSGAEMSPQDLLRMQALVYNYSQKIDLASKALSNATSGVKQLMNTQV